MEEVTKEQWKELYHSKKPIIIFVHTPFCATCQLAERMLRVTEELDFQHSFYRLNASLFPDFMTEHQIESVPALLLFKESKVVDKLYAFESVTKLYSILNKWNVNV